MGEFPQNPQFEKEFDLEDLPVEFVRILDRIRRNMEYVQGGVDQEDASASGQITVPSGVKVTIEITPEQDKLFLLEEVMVDPTLDEINYFLKADSVSTDASVLPFGNPFPVKKKLKIEVENTDSSDKILTYISDARQVSKKNYRR